MGCKIYLKKGDRNNATTFYIDVIEKALKKAYHSVEYIDDIRQLDRADIVLVITMYALLDVWKLHLNQKVIYWWQGVVPEELSYQVHHFTIRHRLRILFYTLLEFFLIHRAKLNIFVSDSMLEHYRKKYCYRKQNTFIMPCYNQHIAKNSFYDPQKYARPTFVYSGGMLPWQCVEESIILYKKVKEHCPQATFTILTSGTEDAKRLVEKHAVKDVEIKCVPVSQLNEEHAKYKYGFLLRMDDVVNNVATPTKFNSYLAVGIIPVMSNVIGAYKPILSRMQYAVVVDNEKCLEQAVQQIIKIERRGVVADDIYNEYKHIFDTYYHTESYISDLSDQFTAYSLP